MRRGVSPIVAACILLVVGLIIAIVLGARIMQTVSIASRSRVDTVYVRCAMINESHYVCGIVNNEDRWFIGVVKVVLPSKVMKINATLRPRKSMWLGELFEKPLTCSVDVEGWVCRLEIVKPNNPKPINTITATSTPST